LDKRRAHKYVQGLPVTPMRVPITKVAPMRVIKPSSHYSWLRCFLPQRKRSNPLDCSCLKVFLWLMKIVPGCIYMWLAPCNFHVKQAAHLHGNTAAHSVCHTEHCNYQSHFGHAQYMKAHSNLPNHDTWNHYAYNTINTIPFDSLIEQCLMEEQELISQILPPTIHYTQHPTTGHSVAPPAKPTPQTNPPIEPGISEDQLFDSDADLNHSWEDYHQKVNKYYQDKWPKGSHPPPKSTHS
jgi:hypothetical protein